ncbi:lipase family protein [Xylanimonas protaetiae]|uniref:Lipase n=1 Tax=Xylanimonas protaetiae TaxID=2509457 RepID=A0A4P6F4I8_9MICO|nr:lipase family protein [Xylanimonas protaetiae]QAY69623.1 hypothetical protein ET471_05865 [Xylanimonas protaetiae]
MSPVRLHRPGVEGWLRRAPGAVVVAVAVLLVVGGLVLAVRPLTSLVLLAVTVGVACVLTGAADVADAGRPRWRRALAVVWVLVGVLLLARLETAVALLPLVVALLLVAGAVAAAGDAFARGAGRGERALAAAWALAQVALAVLALLWRDATVVLAALVFALRTTAFGVLLLWRHARGRRPIPPAPRPRRIADGVRWAAAALLVVAVVGTLAVSRQLRSHDVAVPALYDTPAQVPGQPGRLLRDGDFPGQAPAGATVRRILYTTTDAHGAPAVASGLVVAPTTPPPGPRPVVAWNHGTTGIARACAPSLLENGATAESIPAVDEAVAAGWVVVATDYSGQGAEGIFPYLIGEGEARSSLDAVRAAHELPGLDLGDQVAVWGHSQGGHAALWTAALASSYAPELDVVGTAAISPAAEPRALARRLLEPPSSALLSVAVAWVLLPYSATYDDVDLDAHVPLPARPLVREMSQRCTSQPGLIVSALAGAGVAAAQPLYRGDLTGGAVGARLGQNATDGPFGAPLLLAWGSEDEVIPADLQHDYVARLCAAGVPLEQTELPGLSHMGVVLPGSPLLPELMTWTEARFAGAPAPPSGC